MRPGRYQIFVGCALLNLALAESRVQAQGTEVTANVVVQDKSAAGKHKSNPSSADVVVWLIPLKSDGRPAATGHPGPFRLVQKDKMFIPHLSVVPTGSSVDFPNQDPFFHNVFSLFNGKRFDLGLYESGTSRAVHFDREGVSYIFCNIHPEMSAVVLALSTPYFAIAGQDESLLLDNIPAGDYEIHVWIEGLTQPDLDRLVRHVHLSSGGSQSISLDARDLSRQPASHLNKFGQSYEQPPKPAY